MQYRVFEGLPQLLLILQSRIVFALKKTVTISRKPNKYAMHPKFLQKRIPKIGLKRLKEWIHLIEMPSGLHIASATKAQTRKTCKKLLTKHSNIFHLGFENRG